jgi:hypothetical protein
MRNELGLRIRDSEFTVTQNRTTPDDAPFFETSLHEEPIKKTGIQSRFAPLVGIGLPYR